MTSNMCILHRFYQYKAKILCGEKSALNIIAIKRIFYSSLSKSIDLRLMLYNFTLQSTSWKNEVFLLGCN